MCFVNLSSKKGYVVEKCYLDFVKGVHLHTWDGHLHLLQNILAYTKLSIFTKSVSEELEMNFGVYIFHLMPLDPQFAG